MIGQHRFFSGLMAFANRFFLFFFFVFLLFSGGLTAYSRAAAPLLEVISLRMYSNKNHVRIITVFNKKPDYDMLLLANPPRLVMTLPVTAFPDGKNLPQTSGFITGIRYGLDGASRSRMIFKAKVPFFIKKVAVEPLQNNIWQMVVDLARTSKENFDSALQSAQRSAFLAGSDSLRQHKKPFVVVVDAGHGDFDNGAKGVSGVLEKDVTLAFARALVDSLQREPGITAALTREKDVFLRLKERVVLARQYEADLFISIHADHIDLKSMRGATVYTLSDKASDTLAKALAEHENKSDLLDGLPPDEPPEVADILIDLARRETQVFSIDFAERIIDVFRQGNINLIKNPHRYAGFQVLRAPDIPSVLIELGYLSNSEDEKLIMDPLWQKKMVEMITKAVRSYVKIHH